MELMKASAQWASRPADERFISLTELHAHLLWRRQRSSWGVVDTQSISFEPQGLTNVIAVQGGRQLDVTNWSFSQLCGIGKTRADWLREVGRHKGSCLVADNLNFGLKFMRDSDQFGSLTCMGEGMSDLGELRAATGPKYGRVWDEEVVAAVIAMFGDGINGDFRVPGEFGKAVNVTKDNTTLYAGDRDMFIFLADEQNRIEVPGRRNGKTGSLARGFFLWNSEVGKTTLGMGTFLFDYVCCNRIVWGAEQYAEVDIRHVAGAPERWLKELKPALLTYRDARESNIADNVKAAQAAKIETDVAEFMATRFGKTAGASMASIHMLEEERPIETLWDAATAATAYARSIDHQDARVKVEREAGALLKLAA